MFIPCRSFDAAQGDFSPVDVTVNPSTVCLASQFAMQIQRAEEPNHRDLLLIKIALVSGEIITVESTEALRHALNLPTRPRHTLPMGRLGSRNGEGVN